VATLNNSGTSGPDRGTVVNIHEATDFRL